MRADEADGVAIVDHHHRVVFLGQVADAGEIGDDAVHRKHAIRCDETEACIRSLLQPVFQFAHVVVGVAIAPRLRQPYAVDDRGVVERVGDDCVILGQQRLEQSGIGVEAGGIEDRVLHAEKAGYARLELLVLFLRPADEAHGGHTVAIAVERGLGHLAQRLGISKPQIVVGAEIEDLLPADLDLSRLHR